MIAMKTNLYSSVMHTEDNSDSCLNSKQFSIYKNESVVQHFCHGVYIILSTACNKEVHKYMNTKIHLVLFFIKKSFKVPKNTV